MPEYSVAKAAELSLSRLFADRHAADGVLVNALCPGPTKSELWMAEGGLLDQSQEHGGHPDREAALEAAASGRPIGRLAESRGDRGRDRLPLLRARLLRRRRRLVGRRRHRAGDHLSGGATEALRAALLRPEQAERLDAHGATEAAVLVPLFGHPADPGLVFTERRHDLRRHAGEISFPGGRRDHDGEDAAATPRCARPRRRSGSRRRRVEVVGALPPIGTFVTNYKVFPFVGLIAEELALRAQPGRGRDRARVPALGAPRGVCDAPPRAPRDPDPHPDLRRRRAPDLGRDRADPR